MSTSLRGGAIVALAILATSSTATAQLPRDTTFNASYTGRAQWSTQVSPATQSDVAAQPQASAADVYDYGAVGDPPGVWQGMDKPAAQTEVFYGKKGGKGCGGGACCGGFIMGFEATFLAPSVDAAEFEVVPADGGGNIPMGFDEFDYETDVDYLNVAPRLWLGYQLPNCWGVQTRYWQMTNGNDFFDPQVDPTLLTEGIFGDTHSSLKLSTFDLEGTREFCLGGCDMLATLGVRYASFEQHDAVTSLMHFDNAFGFDQYNHHGTALRDYHGTGLTFSLAGSHRLFCDSLSFVWSLRGSTLWGENRASASTVISGAHVWTPPDADVGADSDWHATASDEMLFIGEVQAGLRWESCVPGCNTRVFAHALVEYQYWNANGGNANTYAWDGNPLLLSELASTTRTGDLEMNLVGFSLGAGLTW